MSNDEFWKNKSLAEMSQEEWESLCDGCGKCCMHKLEDEESGEILYTDVACRYLNENCQCKEYPSRKTLVADCLQLSADYQHLFHWLPQTCAYRMLSEGRGLAEWHPLVTGDRNALHRLGLSVKGKFINEEYVHPSEIEERVVNWVS